MVVFIIISVCVMVGAALLIGGTWKHFGNFGSRLWVDAPVLLVALFVLAMLVSYVGDTVFAIALSRVVYEAMAIFNYLLFAALLCWILFGLAKLAGISPNMRGVLFVTYGLAVLVTLAGNFNASCIRTTRQTVRLPNLPAEWEGRDVVLVSDIHLGTVLRSGFARRVVRKIQAINPYAVFIPGDMFDSPIRHPEELLEPWTKLSAPEGVYFVTGNHDEYFDRNAALNAVEKTGIRTLNDEMVLVDGMQILGVHDSDSWDADDYAKRLNHVHLSKERPSILLVHRPERLDVSAKAGVSLQLSGHTHGGQFWPWNLVVSRIFGDHAQGLSRVGNMQLYTSSGVGTWGPPVRIGTKAEIVVLHLERATPETGPER